MSKLTFMHSIFYEYAPISFRHIWPKNNMRNNDHNLRNANDFTLPNPRLELFKRFPIYSLPLEWNQAGVLTLYENRVTFRHALKEQLFSELINEWEFGRFFPSSSVVFIHFSLKGLFRPPQPCARFPCPPPTSPCHLYFFLIHAIVNGKWPWGRTPKNTVEIFIFTFSTMYNSAKIAQLSGSHNPSALT